MRKAFLIVVYVLGLILLAEAAARVKMSLQTNNFRYMAYYKGVVKNQSKAGQLLKPLVFKKTNATAKEVIFVGTSVLNHVRSDLEHMLAGQGYEQFRYIDGRDQQWIEYGKNSTFLLEVMILPAIYNDFFNARNKLRQMLGSGLYDTLYNNSVFFLMLSEKLTGAVAFSDAARKEFVDETSAVLEQTFRNIRSAGARLLLINFPNFFLHGENKVFGKYCGEVAETTTKALQPLVDAYSISYLDIYTLHNDEFKREDYTDLFHLHNEGAKRAAAYIVEAMKALP